MTENINNEERLTNVGSQESEFLTGNMTKTFWKYAVMAACGILGSCIAVIIDGFFMGNAVGAEALAAISVCLTLMYFAMGYCAMMGVGASTLAGIKLGEGDEEGARDIYGAILIFSLISSIIISALALIFLNPLLRLLGATDTVLPYARDYAVLFWCLFPLSVLGQVGYYFCRLAEKPRAALIAFIAASVGAVVFEYIVVFILKLGVVGSAVSFVVGIAGTVFLLPYLQGVKNIFKLAKKNLKINMNYVVDSIKIGFPMFLFNLCPLITTVIINNELIAYGGSDLHLSAFAIFNAYIVYVMNALTSGFTAGIQPIASTNMGAKAYGRVRKLIKTGVFQSFIVLLIIQILVMLFARPVVSFFAGGVEELVDLTVKAMRINIALFAFGNVATLVGGYFIAVEKNLLAILNSTTRVLIFAVPILFIAPKLIGLDGVWFAQPIADVLACILAVICIVKEYKALGKLEEKIG